MTVISHNITAMNAQRQFGININNKAKSSEKLSSGYRINRAADDAAGLSISEKMRRQIRGLSKASQNSEEGISLIQVADGAMHEVHAILQRGHELCIQAANGTLSDEDRAAIQAEMEQLEAEINALSEKTTFNEILVLKGKEDEQVTISPGNAIIKGGFPSWAPVSGVDSDGYMDGTFTNKKIFKDTNGNETEYTISHVSSTIDFSAYDGSDTKKKELLGQGFYTTCCTCSNHYSIKFTEGTGSSMEQSGRHYIFNIGIDGITSGEGLIDAIISGTYNGVNSGEPLKHYTIFEKDAMNPNQLVVYDVRSKDSNPAAGQSGEWLDWEYRDGRSDGDVNFNIDSGNGEGTFGVGVAIAGEDFEQVRVPVGLCLQVGAEIEDTFYIELPEISSLALGIDTVDVSTQDGAVSAITLFDKAISYVSGERSRMGAYQNRLEHIIKNLDNMGENLSAAESKIRDTDMAEEMVKFSKENILTQAAQSMLAQANQSVSGILNLLQ